MIAPRHSVRLRVVFDRRRTRILPSILALACCVGHLLTHYHEDIAIVQLCSAALQKKPRNHCTTNISFIKYALTLFISRWRCCHWLLLPLSSSLSRLWSSHLVEVHFHAPTILLFPQTLTLTWAGQPKQKNHMEVNDASESRDNCSSSRKNVIINMMEPMCLERLHRLH